MSQKMLILNVEMIQLLGYVWDLRNARLKSKERNKRIILLLTVSIDTHPKIVSVSMKPLNLKFEMLNNEGGEVYITGDINIDMLLSLGYLTIIP